MEITIKQFNELITRSIVNEERLDQFDCKFDTLNDRTKRQTKDIQELRKENKELEKRLIKNEKAILDIINTINNFNLSNSRGSNNDIDIVNSEKDKWKKAKKALERLRSRN